MRNVNIAAYGEGALYPSAKLANIAPAVRQAGWTTIIAGLFHIGRKSIAGQKDGDIIFNDAIVVSGGTYVGDAGWPAALAGLKGGTITRLVASVGGGGPVEDFATLARIYKDNGKSFKGTDVERNFAAFRKAFPAIDAIDMDCEDCYDPPSFLAFCQMLIGQGFAITFCPYTNMGFWVDALAALEATNPGKVLWWNLQCYAGGTGNDPATWAAAITRKLPKFNTAGYIVPGDWSVPDGDCPDAVHSMMANWATVKAVGGGFLWTLDDIIQSGGSCPGGGDMPAYVKAIATAFA